MMGPGFERRGKSVLIHEYATGGFAGRDLPPSWVVEGAAICRAVAEDFAALPDLWVVVTDDDRLRWDRPSGIVPFLVLDPANQSLGEAAASKDYTVLIAPETDGLLVGMVRAVERAGGRHLGSDPEAVDLVADKARLAEHFQARGIPTPSTRTFDTSGGLPDVPSGPVVVKPIDGAGSLDTYVVREPRRLPIGLGPGRRMLIQPFHPGSPMSASFLVDRDGRAWWIAVGRQRSEVDGQGRLSYRGGTVPAPTSVDLAGVARAVDSVAGLRGFVGVDFLDDGRGGALILEINPRPTTSYRGLARLLPPGTIAGAWLAAASAGLDGTDWPDRLRAARDHPSVSFEADGSDRPEGWPER